jgi:hypothetical protein
VPVVIRRTAEVGTLSERDVAPPTEHAQADGRRGCALDAQAVDRLIAGVLDQVGEAFGVRTAGADVAGGAALPELVWARLDGDGLRAGAKAIGRVVAALEYQQRSVLGLIEARGAFADIGARDAVEWATVELGMSRGRAVDQIEIGKQLGGLPQLAEAAQRGALSTEQVKPAVQLAAADRADGVGGGDRSWARNAPKLPVATLQRRAAKRRRPPAADHVAARKARSFQCWERGQELFYRGSLPIDEGRRLLAGIERAMPAREVAGEGPPLTLDQRRADGLVALSRVQLGADADADRATVAAIVELAAVCDDDPVATAELEDSQPLATETARRLVCDSRVQVVVQDRSGVAVGVGSTSRTVSPGMRRVVNRRDGRCRFGECTATGFRLEAHHVVPWPSPTTMGNLAMLCWHHHHMVHEGGWRLSGDPNDALHATSPDGTTTLTSHPQGAASRTGPPGGALNGADTTSRARRSRGSGAADAPPVLACSSSSVVTARLRQAPAPAPSNAAKSSEARSEHERSVGSVGGGVPPSRSSRTIDMLRSAPCASSSMMPLEGASARTPELVRRWPLGRAPPPRFAVRGIGSKGLARRAR